MRLRHIIKQCKQPGVLDSLASKTPHNQRFNQAHLDIGPFAVDPTMASGDDAQFISHFSIETHPLLSSIAGLSLKDFGLVSPRRSSYTVLPDSLIDMERHHPILLELPAPSRSLFPSHHHYARWFNTSQYNQISTKITLYQPMLRRFSLEVFMLPPGCIVPIHNHPNMSVLAKIIYGRAKIIGYTVILPDSKYDNSRLIEASIVTNKGNIGENSGLHECYVSLDSKIFLKPSKVVSGSTRKDTNGEELVDKSLPTNRSLHDSFSSSPAPSHYLDYIESPNSAIGYDNNRRLQGSTHGGIKHSGWLGKGVEGLWPISSMHMTYPHFANLHCIQALTPCLIFELIYPPYRDEEDCKYYQIERANIASQVRHVEEITEPFSLDYKIDENERLVAKQTIPKKFSCTEVKFFGNIY